MTSKTKKNENPSPLAKRICKCGCENEFQPNRSNHYNVNYKHTNFAYNHGPRKEKYAEENQAIKAIRKNDRILEKYFKYCKKIRGDLIFITLKADGFNEEIFTRILTSIEDEIEIKYFTMYKYCYRIINQANNKYIRIHKI